MRVLFVGNSHTYFNDMPELFACMYCQIEGTRPEVTMLAYSGRDLKWHRSEYFSLRFALMYGSYDYCLIQQQAHPFPEEDFTEQWLDQVVEMCRRCHVKPIIYMTWAAKAQPEMTAVMSSFYRRMAEKHCCDLLPVGEMFADITQIGPEYDLYWNDGEHASPYGDYMIASSLVRFITGRDISPLTADGIDFAVRFDPETSLPQAEENTESVTVKLDEKTVELIKKIVMKTIKEK